MLNKEEMIFEGLGTMSEKLGYPFTSVDQQLKLATSLRQNKNNCPPRNAIDQVDVPDCLKMENMFDRGDD